MARRRSAAALLTTAALAGVAVLSGCTTSTAPPAPTASSSPSDSVAPPSMTESAGVSSVEPSTAPAVPPTPTRATPSGAPTQPATPAAARLDGLSGKAPTPAASIKLGSLTRTQGGTPGEYTESSPGGGFHWFGADGATVGCRTGTVCVGYDAAGNTVAVPDGKVRLVYGPDGKALGRFDSSGRPVGGGQPPMEQAVAATRVDVAGLVDAASRRVPFAGGVTGDPHLITAGGTRYSTQLLGQFVARANDPERMVQLSFVPLPNSGAVSIVSALGVRTGSQTIELGTDSLAALDGKTLPAPQPMIQQELANGAVLGRWQGNDQQTGYAVLLWPDGGSLVAIADPNLGMTVVTFLPQIQGQGGLFGTGRPSLPGATITPNLLDRSGNVRGVNEVVADWRARDQERLFAETPATASSTPAPAPTVPSKAAEFGQQQCERAGITASLDVSACSFDVGLTGDRGFLPGHVAMSTPVESTLAPAIGRRWTALTMTAELPAAQPVPELIDTDVQPRRPQYFTVPIRKPGPVGLEFVSGCRDNQPAHPPADAAAVRLFDAAGRAVTPRWPTCGQPTSAALPAGTYYLQIAAPAQGSAQQVRVEVQLP